jgi:hypothetical protein
MCDNQPSMNFKRNTIHPMVIVPINGKFILAVYKGRLSQYDLLLKYRQKNKNGKWSRLRTPKHIHWAVDILIKMHFEENATKSFLDFLIKEWENIQPLESEQDRSELLNSNKLLAAIEKDATQYNALADKGEYNIKFLILLAKLLMMQEKTNNSKAFMFGKLLEKLKEGSDIYGVVSTAAFGKRK